MERDDSMLTLRVSGVPLYLHKSDFYRNLSVDDDETFSLMKKHFKVEMSASSAQELDHLLSTLQFWGLDQFPKQLTELLLQQDFISNSLLEERYGDLFPVIRTIFRVHQVKRTRDKINVAISGQSFEVIKYLLDAKIPFNEASSGAAAETGSVALLQFIHERGCVLHSIATAYAAQKGSLACLKYLYEHGCAWHGSLGNATADGGHLACLLYAMENGYNPANKSDLCGRAASKGHFLYFEHFVKQKWYTDERNLLRNAVDSGDVACVKFAFSLVNKWEIDIQERIVKSKSLECFVFSVDTGLRYNLGHTALIVSLRLLEFMKYLVNNVAYTVFDAYSMLCAVTNRDLDCIKCLHWCGCRICDSSHRKAAELGFVEWFQFVHSVGAPISRDACSVAALNGHLQCVEVLHELQAPWDETTCSHAARNGHLDVLRYLHESGCPWDEETTAQALQHKQMKCFQYAREHGCPMSIKVWAFLVLGIAL